MTMNRAGLGVAWWSRAATTVRLLWRQIHYDWLLLRRNPQVRVLTMLLPFVFLVLFVAMFGNNTLDVEGSRIRQSTYYVPAIMTFAVVDAAFMTLLVGIVTQRERGVFKRRKLTPEPSWVVIVGGTAGAVGGAVVLAVVIWVFGRVAYGAQVSIDLVPATITTVAIGAATFCCLAYAVSPFVRTIDSAVPVAALLTLPLVFVSGIFVPWQWVPEWLQIVASVFPVRPLTHALVHAFRPTTQAPGFVAADLLALGAWGVIGLVVGRRFFRWLPRTDQLAP
jgi:ABC-2 type transport system permease protein